MILSIMTKTQYASGGLMSTNIANITKIYLLFIYTSWIPEGKLIWVEFIGVN